MDGRSVVIGGAGGIGMATCRALAQAGQQVILADFHPERTATAAAQLQAEGLDVVPEICDATSGDQMDALRDRIESQHGPVDVVVALAGVARNALLVKITDEDFNLTLSTHLNGTLNALRTFLPGMRKRGYGRAVTMSSIAARGSFGGASYSAAKAAIEGLTRTAAIEMAPSGVTVNCVAPGIIGTGIFHTTPQDYQDKCIALTPMQRVGTPEEVAACIRFLASRDASFVTGHTFKADGGLSIGPI